MNTFTSFINKSLICNKFIYNYSILFFSLTSLCLIPSMSLANTLQPTYTLTIQPSGVVNMQNAATTSLVQSLTNNGDNMQISPTYKDKTNSSDRNGKTGPGIPAVSSMKAKSNPEVLLSINGLNARDTRFANNGNQFQIEPPDQGLCAGNGHMFEIINDALRIYKSDGTPVTGVIANNTFFGYPPEFDRSNFIFGPVISDPMCVFDADSQRWYVSSLVSEIDPDTGDFTGPSHLDLAVSQTSDPTGAYFIYHIPAQNDGTQGTPNHHCPGAIPGSEGPCFPDFPKLGVDKNGVYLTANEFSVFAEPHFLRSALIYVLPKGMLTSGASNVPVKLFDTLGMVNGEPARTIWPANAPANQYVTDQNGTEYFVSTTIEDFTVGSGNQLIVWALTNTASLNTSNPNPLLSFGLVPINFHTNINSIDQKSGPAPLRECINDTTNGCWQLFFDTEPAHNEPIEMLHNGSGIRSSFFANGKLWNALSTAVTINNHINAGILWVILNPSVSSNGVSAKVVKQGVLALANNNLIYPGIAVSSSGRGIMGFTLSGQDYFPSVGYVSLDAIAGAGLIHVVANGLGPEDGFSGYAAFGGDGISSWGDYGMGAVDSDGKTLWIANEYIGQMCTLDQYLDPSIGFLSCAHTRTSLTNWYTRVTKLQVQ